MITSNLGKEVRDALLELEEDMYLPAEGEGYQTFLWKGKSIRCVANMQGASSELVFGGQDTVVEFSLTVRRDYFLTADSTLITIDTDLYTADDETPTPVSGRYVTFRGKNYRISSAKMDSTGAFFRLVLSDKYSGK